MRAPTREGTCFPATVHPDRSGGLSRAIGLNRPALVDASSYGEREELGGIIAVIADTLSWCPPVGMRQASVLFPVVVLVVLGSGLTGASEVGEELARGLAWQKAGEGVAITVADDPPQPATDAAPADGPATVEAKKEEVPIAPAPALVDPKTVRQGLPVIQKLNPGEKTPFSAAMQACLLLVGLHFVMSFLGYLTKFRSEIATLQGKEIPSYKQQEQEEIEGLEGFLNDVYKNIKSVTDAIPMFVILIVFCRLRAKVDLEGSNPPDYARKAFYTGVACIYLQAFLETILFCNGRFFTWTKGALGVCLRCGLYVSIILVFHSIFVLTKTEEESFVHVN